MKKKTKEIDRKVFSFFQLSFPTLLITAFAMLSPETTWWAIIVLAIYQMILLKQFLDRYYEY